MEIAVDDINRDPIILNGTKLKLIVEDCICRVFIGPIKGQCFNLLQEQKCGPDHARVSSSAIYIVYRTRFYSAASCCQSAAEPQLPRPRLPYPRINGLHIYTYRGFWDAVNIYLG